MPRRNNGSSPSPMGPPTGRARAVDFFTEALSGQARAGPTSRQHPNRANVHSSVQAQRLVNTFETLSLDDSKSMIKHHKDFLRSTIPFAPNANASQEMIDKVEALVVRVIRVYLMSNSREKVIEDAAEEFALDEKVEATDCDNKVVSFVEEFQKIAELAEQKFKKSLTDEFVKRHELFVKFKADVNELLEGLESLTSEIQSRAIATTSTTASGAAGKNDGIHIPTVDPITKGPLLNPIKNKFCSHVYGKTSIMAMMSSNKKARCPYAGCSNVQYLRQAHLIVDPVLADKIAKKIQEASQNSNRAEFNPNLGDGVGNGQKSNSIFLDGDELD